MLSAFDWFTNIIFRKTEAWVFSRRREKNDSPIKSTPPKRAPTRLVTFSMTRSSKVQRNAAACGTRPSTAQIMSCTSPGAVLPLPLMSVPPALTTLRDTGVLQDSFEEASGNSDCADAELAAKEPASLVSASRVGRLCKSAACASPGFLSRRSYFARISAICSSNFICCSRSRCAWSLYVSSSWTWYCTSLTSSLLSSRLRSSSKSATRC
mmetsp:Transcript_57994/g.135880  ORF Transcript_57994/g.135880 Transcript_57994/m.135880 type:complete len:210 (-) Transcript_57994:1976-2605(-)